MSAEPRSGTERLRRTMPGGRVKPETLPKGVDGRTLCRWCSLQVPRGRRTFCSDDCVHQWRLRTNAGYLREQVLARDHGVCARCTVDTLAAYRQLRRAKGERRRELLAIWGLQRLGRRSLWDADHVLPVAEGGGECDLANLRTLCLHCHRIMTAGLRARLAKKRAMQGLDADLAARMAQVPGWRNRQTQRT